MNVTAEAKNESSIMVKWEIGIHDQLIARNLTIEYCGMKDNEPGKVNELCSPCRYKNITNISPHTELLTGLRSYTRYSIKARAINIVARDKTEVTTPYGEYSNPDYAKTSDAGE